MAERFPHLDVRVASLGEMFKSVMAFEMPWFQRSYAWGVDHVDRLITEVEAAAADPARDRYFLGHVCLAGEAGAAHRIIDGQQRIMTLTMPYALLRDGAPAGTDTSALDALLWAPVRGATSRPKVLAQDCVRDFFRRAVLEPGATATRIDPYRARLTDTGRRFLANRNRMASLISPMREDGARWQRFVSFLLDRCYVIVETVATEEEAWDMLAKEEERRATHHESEQAKATLVGVMPREEQAEAGRIWDEINARIGADNVARLLSHLRTMLIRRRSMRPVIVEISEGYGLRDGGLGFMRNIMAPHAAAFDGIRARRVGSRGTREEISLLLSRLELVDHDLWVAPLLRWLQVNPGDDAATLAFVAALDRLVMMLRISAVDPTNRERRFIALTAEIQPGVAVGDLQRLKVEDGVRRQCETNLRSRTLQYKHYAAYALRRLTHLLGDVGSAADDATIEHVLPRNPPGGSPWWAAFRTEKIVDDHAHRLGNLVLLSFAHNQAAGNLSFIDKKPILAGSGFALARDAAMAKVWTRETVLDRTERLANLLLAE